MQAPRPTTSSGGRRPSRHSTSAPICEQRLGHAVHRAAADRLVAVERPLPCALPRQPAGKQAQQCPGVADVDAARAVARALAGAVESDPGDLEVERPGAATRR